MPSLPPCPESPDPWRTLTDAPLLGINSTLLLVLGALAMLFSLST